MNKQYIVTTFQARIGSDSVGDYGSKSFATLAEAIDHADYVTRVIEGDTDQWGEVVEWFGDFENGYGESVYTAARIGGAQ